MKLQLTGILVVALLVVLSLFFGLGVGAGALSGVGLPKINDVTSGPGGFNFQVQIAGLDRNGFYASDYFPNGSSQPITFDTYVWVGNASCSQYPAWQVGGGSGDYIYYTVSVSYQGAIESIPGTANGYLVISDNLSAVNSAWCNPNSRSAGGGFFQHTVFLPGIYSDYSIVTIAMSTVGRYCAGSLSGNTAAACNLGGQSSNSLSGTWFMCNGRIAPSFPIGCNFPTASSQAILRSGYSYLTQPTGTFFNGGTLPISFSTGYTVGGWKICFQWPAVRSNGGQNIACNNVGQNSIATTTFSIPNNAAIITGSNCTVPCQSNIFQATLYSSLFPGAFIPSISVDISPLFQPGVPTITFIDNTQSSGTVRLGDSITITATSANPANSSTFGTVNSFVLGAYYSIGESTPPVSTSYWVNANPSGFPMNLVSNSGGATGTYTFTVGQGGTGNGATIVGTVTAITTKGQSSQNTFSIQVTPSNCGTPSCNTVKVGSFWQTIGPALLSVAIVIGSALAALYVPAKMKYVVIVAGIGIVILLYLSGAYLQAFSSGGLFNVNGV